MCTCCFLSVSSRARQGKGLWPRIPGKSLGLDASRTRDKDGGEICSPLLGTTHNFLSQELPFISPEKPCRHWGGAPVAGGGPAHSRFTFALVESLRCSTALQLSCGMIKGNMASKKVQKPHSPNLQSSLESLMGNIEVCRSVGLEIINNTKKVTLEEFRCASSAPLLLSASLP